MFGATQIQPNIQVTPFLWSSMEAHFQQEELETFLPLQATTAEPNLNCKEENIRMRSDRAMKMEKRRVETMKAGLERKACVWNGQVEAQA